MAKVDATQARWFDGWDWVKVTFVKTMGRYRIDVKPHNHSPVIGIAYTLGAGEWVDSVREATMHASGLYEAGIDYYGDPPVFPTFPTTRRLKQLEAEREALDAEIARIRTALQGKGFDV